ncbi:hypothetical protein SARC_11580 [Sphaeroforma arctica JP610]|uniref:Uncharacterized protein n=1 Tax=Sphaeroforma arctica JP610 TaxID=667725 RepID=A0A0L0FGK5_9EUKA|nr:hypothetical protein SARC_11580 [Sphaeroforma arctica JP610]KNC75905.1 hypothetical protein SARC_11580 [Sphaeroforma arctica JP610]|eukprot:XP_014149807.1 hypothetical protein SARC_11580 [Sphaeroforma arctica JP610]
MKQRYSPDRVNNTDETSSIGVKDDSPKVDNQRKLDNPKAGIIDPDKADYDKVRRSVKAGKSLITSNT